MIEIGKRVFYDIRNGEVVAIVGERSGHVRPTTIEEDIDSFPKLQERNRETFDYLDLEYGAFQEDFSRGKLVAIDLETKELKFVYYEDMETKPTKPLSVQVEELKMESKMTLMALAEKHEESLELQKENERLQRLSLVALQGVAEVNEEIAKIKKSLGN